MKKTDRSHDEISSTEIIHETEKAYFDQKTERYLEEIEVAQLLVNPESYQSTLKLWGLDRGLNGVKILECACGTGFFSVLLAKMGAEIWCFDLSPKSIEMTKKRAVLNGVSDRVRAQVGAFEHLAYDDEMFDLIVGKNILHHIPDIKEAGRQMRRVLKREGKAIFYELSANNPILMFFRKNVIDKSRLIPKLGTPDEHPLTSNEIEELSAIFNNRCKVSYPKFRFFGKLDRQVFKQRYKPVSLVLEGLDRMIYSVFPPLRKYSYKILLEFTR